MRLWGLPSMKCLLSAALVVTAVALPALALPRAAQTPPGSPALLGQELSQRLLIAAPGASETSLTGFVP